MIETSLYSHRSPIKPSAQLFRTIETNEKKTGQSVRKPGNELVRQ
jgi:hypothetical protein